MNLKHFITGLLLLGCMSKSTIAQQETTPDEHTPKLMLDFMLLDAPYVSDALQSRANYRTGNLATNPASIKGRDFIALIESPSMPQVMAYSSSYYNAMNYGVAKLWNHLKDPTTSKSAKLWNNIGKEFTAAVAFVATTKVPFAGGWAHEEFHRNTWAQHGISSYNHVWDLNDLAPDALTYVGNLQDDDLAYFKAKDPAGFARMGSSGIEAHYLMNERLQLQDFCHNTNLPNLAVYWADVIAAADYVNRAHTTATIEEHAHVYNNEPDQLKRDFTGNDFTAWVYDLFRADEAYSERGMHPTGIGIDRYRDYTDLSRDMLRYVEKMGDRQWLNLVSPFMFRIREIPLKQDVAFNFAVRHFLTSFGDDIQMELFLRHKDQKHQLTFHRYSNYENWFPGLEVRSFLSSKSLGTQSKLNLSYRAMAWAQPKDQAFKTSDYEPGGLVSLEAGYRNSNQSKLLPYLEFEGKTSGWVAGQPYLRENFSARIGIKALL